MHRADDPGVIERAIEFSKTLPYATGWLLAKDGSSGTVFFLNETTAVTSAHAFVGREKMPHIVVASDHVQICGDPQTTQFDWTLTLNNLKKSGTPWTSLKKQTSLAKYTTCQPVERSILDYQDHYFLELLEHWENPEKILTEATSAIELNGSFYKYTGADLSVIKFHTPIKLDKKPFVLEAFNCEDLSNYSPYSFGIPGDKITSDKRSHDIPISTKTNVTIDLFLTGFQAHNIKLSQNKSTFYSKLYSLGGTDDSFLCTGLPSPQTTDFIGLMLNGMSGGPLVFINSKGDYLLAGLNSGVLFRNVKNILDMLFSNIDILKKSSSVQENKDFDAWKKSIEKYYRTPFPIYNHFQAFTPEIIKRITEIMEK